MAGPYAWLIDDQLTLSKSLIMHGTLPQSTDTCSRTLRRRPTRGAEGRPARLRADSPRHHSPTPTAYGVLPLGVLSRLLDIVATRPGSRPSVRRDSTIGQNWLKFLSRAKSNRQKGGAGSLLASGRYDEASGLPIGRQGVAQPLLPVVSGPESSDTCPIHRDCD